MIERVDIAVRLVACGANLLLLVLLLSGEVRRGLKLPLAGLLIGSIGYLLNSSSAIVHAMAVWPWIDLAAVFTPFFTWLFALRIFEREPPRAAVAGFAMLLLGGWLIGYFPPAAHQDRLLCASPDRARTGRRPVPQRPDRPRR